MIIKAFAILKNEERFLLIREAPAKWKGKWFLPGGKADLGESPVDAAKREVTEEAGFEIEITGIAYIRYQDKIFRNQLSLFYTATITGGVLKTLADKHSLEAKWFTLAEIRELSLRQKLSEILNNCSPDKIIPPGNFRFYP